MPFEKGHQYHPARSVQEETKAVSQAGEVAVHRFDLGDIDRMGMWLVKRIREMFKDADDRTVIGWMRSCIQSNEYMFLCSEDAVGLAVMLREPLHRQPIVDEIFVVVRNGATHEGVAIYREIKRWAGAVGARRCQVRVEGDVPRDMIKTVFGMIYIYEVCYGKP